MRLGLGKQEVQKFNSYEQEAHGLMHYWQVIVVVFDKKPTGQLTTQLLLFKNYPP